MPQPPTVICRCEGVTLEEVQKALASFRPSGLRELKLVTRLAMGICQGRVCRPAVEALARELGVAPEAWALPLRPPFRPTPLSRLGEAGEEDSP